MSEAGPPGGTGQDPGAARNEAWPADVERWMAAWRQRLQDDDRLPEDEGRLVVTSVLDELVGGHPDDLDRAGWAWGRAHRSVSSMVGRLSRLREALAAGGVDDPLRMHRALDRVTAAATEEVLNRLERASRTDALTGVGNRRAFDETLSAALSAASRQGHDVTVVAVDLDGLKRINDTEGHAAGDAALLGLVRVLYSALRDEDTVFRVGGDEFVVLLPFTSVSAAELLMERVHGTGAPAFTWGAAGFPGDGPDPRALVAAADADLYRRREGRRGVVAPSSERAARRRPGERPRLTWRWAWVPAAAVLLGSMVATLLSGGTAPVVSAGRGSHPQGSASQGAGQPPGPAVSSGGSLSRPGTTAGTGSSPGLFSVTSSTSPGTSPSSGTQPGGPGSSPSSPNSPGTPSGPPPAGGLLGTLEQIAAPVPVVGGNNGLLATVGQVVTGTTYASPSASAPLSTAATPNGAGSSSGLLGLLGVAQPFG